jgi:hypothetical protein
VSTADADLRSLTKQLGTDLDWYLDNGGRKALERVGVFVDCPVVVVSPEFVTGAIEKQPPGTTLGGCLGHEGAPDVGRSLPKGATVLEPPNARSV